MTGKTLLVLIGSVCLILVLAVLPFMGACAPEEEVTPPPEEEVTPPPEEEVTPPFKPVTLKFAYTMPEKMSLSAGWHLWAEKVEKDTGGKVKVEFYPGGTLFKLDATVDSIIAGVADISMTSCGGLAERFPVSNATGLPALGFPDTYEGNVAADDAFMTLIEKCPQMKAEFTDFKVLWDHQLLNYIMVSKKPIHVPTDLEGVKVGGTGAKMEIVKGSGGVVVSLPPPETYMNMQTGVVDAVFLSWSQLGIYKIWEVGKYFLDFGFGVGMMPIIMNWDSWNHLPADIQSTVMAAVPYGRSEAIKAMFVRVDKGREGAAKAGVTVYTPTAADVALWQKAAEPVWDAWVADMKAKGVRDPESVLAEWKKLVAAYGK